MDTSLPSTGLSNSAAPLDVLFVDDDEDIAMLMTEYLRRCGYTVASAGNGEVALKILRRQPVALVVTDILMPEMDGYEVIMKIRESPRQPRIIAMSGNSPKLSIDLLKSASQLGADHILAKPFLPQELLVLVEAFIGPRPAPAIGV